MDDRDEHTTGHRIAFELYGAGVVVAVDDPLLAERLDWMLPWGARKRDPRQGDRSFELLTEAGDRFSILEDGRPRYTAGGHGAALSVLKDYLVLHVLHNAPEVLFLHAGAVGFGGRAIVLPGPPGTGKSTLVAALIRAGAEYYSDDYVPLDTEGRAHPYPMPVRLRDPTSGEIVGHSPEDLGGVGGVEPIPVGIVATLPRHGDRGLELESRSAGEGALMLLANALGSDRRAAFALAVARQAVAGASVLAGTRGEADEAARALLELASSAWC